MIARAHGQLGIDLGGTKVAFVARVRFEPEAAPGQGADARDADAVGRYLWPATGGLDADIGALGTWCRAIRDGYRGAIGSVGAAVPATLDASGRVVTWPNRPHWAGFDLRGFLEATFGGAVVRCADDGNLAALAEAHQSGLADLAYVGVGTGIGGGLVLGGKIRPRLADGCEIGHLLIDLNGVVCTCGRQGCVQAVASGPATLRRAGQYRGVPVSAADLADGLARGESWAVTAVTESARALAAVVVNLGELLRVELVRIGGGFASSLDGLIPAVLAEAARLGRPGHPPAAVEAAAFGPDSSLYGALLLADSALDSG